MGSREHGKNQLVHIRADHLEVRAAESGGDHSRTTQGRNIDFSRNPDPGKLGTVGDENHLVVEAFFSKEAGIVGDSDTDICAADRAITDPHPVRGECREST